jgi:hypothetical protein
MQRVDIKQLEALVRAASPGAQYCARSYEKEAPATRAAKRSRPTITIDDFAKIDLRIARSCTARRWKARPSCCA